MIVSGSQGEYRVQRFIMAATLLLALGFGLVIDRSASAQESFSCDDFTTFDEAFDAFVAAGGPQEDPNGVDPDRDGFPCEDLDGTPDDARSAASNEYPQSGDSLVGSEAGDSDSSPVWTSVVGSEATDDDANDSTGTVDGSFVGSASQTGGDSEPTGIGPYVGTAGQSEDAPDAADTPDSTGIGSYVGGEVAWTDGTATDESVWAMPSTGVGSVETALSGMTIGLIALLSVLALGAGTAGLVRVRRG